MVLAQLVAVRLPVLWFVARSNSQRRTQHPWWWSAWELALWLGLLIQLHQFAVPCKTCRLLSDPLCRRALGHWQLCRAPEKSHSDAFSAMSLKEMLLSARTSCTRSSRASPLDQWWSSTAADMSRTSRIPPCDTSVTASKQTCDVRWIWFVNCRSEIRNYIKIWSSLLLASKEFFVCMRWVERTVLLTGGTSVQRRMEDSWP